MSISKKFLEMVYTLHTSLFIMLHIDFSFTVVLLAIRNRSQTSQTCVAQNPVKTVFFRWKFMNFPKSLIRNLWVTNCLKYIPSKNKLVFARCFIFRVFTKIPDLWGKYIFVNKHFSSFLKWKLKSLSA